MKNNVKINHWAVIGSSVLIFVLAFIWYGSLFGDAWAKGAEIANPVTPPVWATISSYIVGLFSCYGISYLLKWTNRSGLKNGITIGLFVSIAFLLQVVIGPWLFSGRFLLFAVNMPYFTLSAILAGAIIGATMKPINAEL
ncbi:DUF1761 domain-containing protein [Flagellimonas lutimaris]|uniref:DUF1761 domain-containing protein n=1 Tax=Flagellimonas lutimaris TaxID=475082 RepID=UPI003F5CCED7